MASDFNNSGINPTATANLSTSNYDVSTPLDSLNTELESIKEDAAKLQSFIQKIDDMIVTTTDFTLECVLTGFVKKARELYVKCTAMEDEEFTEANLQDAQTSIVQLENYLQKLGERIKLHPDGEAKWKLVELHGAAKQKLASLKSAAHTRDTESRRVETVWFRIQEEGLLHSFDLNRLVDLVLDLFKWHTDKSNRDHFMAPYFPLVQSSGMGKTKLLFELRNYILKKKKEIDCQTILFQNGLDISNETESSHVFNTKIILTNDDKPDRKKVCSPLDSILKKCKKSKLVLLFDESQHLLAEEGFYFRCVRWWLRLKRKRNDPQVVAVFTGTTFKLTNFYREPAISTTSRDGSSNYYEQGHALHEPFYDICTIGLFTPSKGGSDQNEYERAIPHGRPLFALMHQQGRLSKQALESILSRMLLQAPSNAWECNLEACLSVLGVRIQMGQTSFSLSSDLVAKGYALLSNFLMPNNNGPNSAVARVFFPPDPVCARLAMCLMDEGWSLGTQAPIQGKSKTFWVKTMSKIFCMGLCMPNQGNLGEIGAALYLLFCGDVLRKKQQQEKKMPACAPSEKDCDSVVAKVEDEYTTFSVPLADFVRCLLSPNDFYSSREEDDDYVDSTSDELEHLLEVVSGDDETDHECKTDDVNPVQYDRAEINFIQVTTNYFRFSIEEMSQQAFLQGLYQSGCALYAYPLCHVIDMVGSVRLTESNGLEHYVPLLVSISTIHQKGSQKRSLQRMRELLTNAKTFGLCIRLMFAFPGQEVHQMKNLLEVADVETLRCGKTVSKTVLVPADDPFGIVKVLLETTSFGPPESEVYSSHYFCQLGTPRDLPKTLLRSRTNIAAKNYARDMHHALWKKQETMNRKRKKSG